MQNILPRRQSRSNKSLGDIRLSVQKMSNRFLVNNESDEDALQKTKGRIQQANSQKTISAYSPIQGKNKLPKSQNTQVNSDKAFFILLEQIWELLKISSGTPQNDIDDALKTQSMSDVAMLIGDKIQLFKLDYVKQEFINIQLKEQLETYKQSSILNSQLIDPDISFKQYAKVHEANQRWKSLFFAEARTVVDLCKNLCEATAELEKHTQYIDKLQDKIVLQEDKYLDLFEQFHNKDTENISNNLPQNKSRQNIDATRKKENKDSKLQTLNGEKQTLTLQIKELTNQNQKMLQQFQEELRRHHAIQDLRIGDLQYIMSLENKIEEMNIN